jgi:hypothetical protein
MAEWVEELQPVRFLLELVERLQDLDPEWMTKPARPDLVWLADQVAQGEPEEPLLALRLGALVAAAQALRVVALNPVPAAAPPKTERPSDQLSEPALPRGSRARRKG